MKKAFGIFLLPVFLITIGKLQAQDDQVVVQIALSDLEWLEGTWKVEGAEMYEEWTVMEDGSLEGKGIQIKGGDTIQTETLRIVEEDNNVVYKATVPTQNGGEEISFAYAGLHGTDLMFENPAHDFPSRIQYTAVEGGKKIMIRLFQNEEGAFIQRMAFHVIRQ